MHQPILAPDLSGRPVPTVSLCAGDRWIRVPAWWAAENHYRHGQSIPARDALDARIAAAQSRLAVRRITRIRTRPMDPHISPEDRRSQREFDAWRTPPRRIASARLEQQALNRPPAIDEAEAYHAGLADDEDDAPSAVTVWLVVAAGMTLVGLGIWLL